MRLILLFFFLLGFATNTFAQVPNDICLYATPIYDVDDYCSESLFTNENAEEDPNKPTTTCFLDFKHAVWFSFTPVKPAVVVRVTGAAGSGTLAIPQVAVFEGPCDNLVQKGCSPNSTKGVAEIVVADLILGKTYYLMVDGFNEGTGSFQLCINDFVPIPNPQSDCQESVLLCDKTAFQVESLVGVGNDKNEVDVNSCIAEEFASSWYKWTCKESGTLTFVITPNNNDPNKETDDIDFAIYRLPGGIDDCANKEIVRCMASGANQSSPYSEWAICNGPTGLNESSTDITEAPGCSNNSDNFVKALDMVAGESYVLVVNNFSQSGLGFSIDFGGTGTFLGPEVNFEIDAVAEFECDKTITFKDSSYTDVGNIVSWTWNFGAGSTPLSENTPGPHQVIYESFGNKITALTIESAEGCRVTKVIDFFIEPCCEDFPDLDVTATLTDNICAGDSTAVIVGEGIAGNPAYSYSLDGVNFAPNPKFPNLTDGSYTLYIQDIKGCTDSTALELIDPPALIVTAGADIDIVLGDSAIINAFYTPPGTATDLQWFGNLDWLPCDTCLTPYARPFKSTEYVIQVTNQAGCIALDTMQFNVEIIRPFFAPNAFSPNGDGVNDWFNLFSTNVALEIDELVIFDRWGSMVYQGRNIPFDVPSAGWDGRYKGKALQPDVYVWFAKIRYIDGLTELFSGDFTLVK